MGVEGGVDDVMVLGVLEHGISKRTEGGGPRGEGLGLIRGGWAAVIVMEVHEWW